MSPRQWMPKVAGIIDLVVGSIVGVFAVILLVGGIMTWGKPGGGNIFVLVSIIFLALGIPAIVGGIHAIKKKRWQLAFNGSLFIAVFWGAGIISAVLLYLSREEFK